MIKKILKSEIINYSLFSYLGQGIAFINILLLSQILSLKSFGEYSLITLILSYLSYSSLGVNYSFVNYLSIKVKKINLSTLIYGNTIVFISFVFIIILCISLLIMSQISSSSYLFDYFILVYLIALFNSFNNIYIKLYRVYNNIIKLIFNQFFPPFCLLILIIIKNEILTVFDVLLIMCFARFFCFLYFLINPPLKLFLKFNYRLFKILIKKGLNLLSYNFSFGFISICTLSVFSFFNSIEDFGSYKLAYTISTIPLLIGGAVENLIYPKVFNRINKLKEKKLEIFMKKINSIYIFSMVIINVIILHLAVLLEYFLKNHENLGVIIFSFLLGNIFLVSTYHLRILFVTKSKENILTIISLASCFAIIIINLILNYYEIHMKFHSISYTFGSLVFLILVGRNSKFHKLITDKKIISFINLLIIFIAGYLIINKIFYPLCATAFLLILINFNRIKYLLNFSKSLIYDNNALKI